MSKIQSGYTTPSRSCRNVICYYTENDIHNMRVYLDNNILVSIEEHDYSLEDIVALLPEKKITFLYSSAHLSELQNFKGSKKYTIEELFTQRFNTLNSICKNNYINYDLIKNEIKIISEEPRNVLETINQIPLANSAIKIFSNLFSKELKAEFRNEIGINMLKINEYSANEIINHLNTKLTVFGTKQSFLELIDFSINLFPNNKEFGLHNKIASVFELLDMLGYWKDKQTETSNEARLWDSLHTYYATYCDFFISDDLRTRNKAKVVFDLYEVKTNIKSIKD